MSFADNFIFAEFLLFCFRNNVYMFLALLSCHKTQLNSTLAFWRKKSEIIDY